MLYIVNFYKRYIGTILASVVSVILYSYYNETGIWRVLFIIGGIASIPFLFLRKKIPESPRWLLNKGLF